MRTRKAQQPFRKPRRHAEQRRVLHQLRSPANPLASKLDAGVRRAAAATAVARRTHRAGITMSSVRAIAVAVAVRGLPSQQRDLTEARRRAP